MHRAVLGILLIASGAFLLALPAGASRPSASLVRQFDYDRSASLAVKERSVRKQSGLVVHDLRFASRLSESIPAYLVVPTGKGPFAAVVIQPGDGLDRRSGLPLARLLAAHGIASLLSDPPLTRMGHGIVLDAAKDRAFWIDTVVEARRGFDLLVSRPEIDAHRLGFVGFSAGASTGAMLAGVEQRVKAYVLQAAGASSEPLIKQGLFGTPPKGAALDSYLRQAITPFEPFRYVGGAAPARMFFQAGKADKVFGRASLDALYRAASSPKRIVWYDSDHGGLRGKPQVVADAVTWLTAQLHGSP